MTDALNLAHRATDQAGHLVAVQIGRRHDERAHASVEERIHLELVAPDVLVFGQQDPAARADRRQPDRIRDASELVVWLDVVARRDQRRRDRAAEALVDVEGGRLTPRPRCFRSGSLPGFLRGCVRSPRRAHQATRPR